MTAPRSTVWWNAPKGKVHATLIDYVRGVDSAQYKIFDRFKKLENLYDPDRAVQSVGISAAIVDRRIPTRPKSEGRMIENIVSRNINTLAAQMSTMDIRATFDTDGADWSEQRRARHREWYCEELAKRFNLLERCQHTTKVGTTLKGTGALKVYADRFDRLCVSEVRPDNIIVDERAYPDGDPLDMYHRECRDAEALAAEFPDFREKIEASRGRYPKWGGWLPIQRVEVVVVEGWRKPIGEQDHPQYIPGRHVICIDGADLWDEEYHDDGFPIIDHRYNKPPTGWYGIGMGQELASHQNALNKRNAQIDRQADHNAHPIISVQRIDQKLAAQTVNTLGTIAVYDGRQAPKVEFGPAVSSDLLASRNDIKISAQEQSGVSSLAMQSRIPARLESGVGVREWAGQKTERFAELEKSFEVYFLNALIRMLKVCKDLGDKAPNFVRRSRFGPKRLKWRDLDTDQIRMQIGVASTLSRTRPGRLELANEMAQAGIISVDEVRRLYGHPDVEREMSLYTAAIESVDECIEEIADGEIVMPEPFMNLAMCVWRGQQQYLIWRGRRAPEEILEALRMFVVNAVWLQDQAKAGAAGPAPTDMPLPPGAPPPGTMLPGLESPEMLAGAGAGAPPLMLPPGAPAGVPGSPV